MVKLFEVKDKNNKIIFLLDKSWNHITSRHPDVSGLEEIRETILKPIVIKTDKFDKALNYYYKFNKIKRRYLMVAAKYLNGEGFIITSFYTKKIRK